LTGRPKNLSKERGSETPKGIFNKKKKPERKDFKEERKKLELATPKKMSNESRESTSRGSIHGGENEGRSKELARERVGGRRQN